MNRVLAKVQFKLHLTNILFFLLNFLHIAIAASTQIERKEDGILRFRINFFSTFNKWHIILAVCLFLLQIIISYIILFQRFRRAELTLITELGIEGNNNVNITKNLRIDPKLIYKWVHEEAEKHQIKTIKRIYLTDTSIPNAMTIDIIPIPFIRSSWIVLDANVLEILDEREIKAVISHELGHVKYLDGIVNIFRYGTNYFVFIAYLLFLLEMLAYISADLISTESLNAQNIFLRIGYFLVIILILWVLTLINNIIMNYSRRQSELMADYYAAKSNGRNHIINALILLGQRLDVISAFGTEFRWLGSRENKKDVSREFLQGIKDLPAHELSKDISREKAVLIYVRQRLKNMKEDLFLPFSDEQIEELTTKAGEKLLKLREEQIGKGFVNDRKIQSELSKLTIDWLIADKDKNLYLSEVEIDQLIKDIVSNPNKELFEHDLYQRRSVFGKDHPSMRNRIIFLYYALPKENSSIE